MGQNLRFTIVPLLRGERKNLMKNTSDKRENAWKSGVERVIDLLSSLFLPFINIMVSVGILKGILIIMIATGIVAEGTATYDILNAMSDAFFYFIPLFLAYTAAKKFNVEPFTAILVACILLHPSMTAVMAMEGAVNFFGLPLRTVTYSASVIPILLAIYCMSFVQKLCYKGIPETFRYLFTPPICVIVIVPVTLLLFGPLGSFVGGWLAKGYEWIYNLSPMVAGILIGALQPFMVILGLHWGLFPIALNNVAVYGYDTIMALFGGAVFAQGGAALAVAIKSKNATFKSQALSASFTALLGITEPAMLGVNLRLKRPMICACVAGAIGSAVAGFFGCRAVSFALPALTTLSLFMGHAFVPFLASLAVSFGLAFLFTMAVTIPDLK